VSGLSGRVVDVDPDPLDLEPGPLAVVLGVDGVPVADLAPGTRLRVGAAVVVELGGPRTAGGLREGAAGDVVAAGVMTGGRIRIGDAVTVEAVAVPLEDALDLHPFRPEEIPAVVDEYLARAQAAGFREVRLIHGRGHGVQRAAVRRALAASERVAAFADAPPDRGGWGATIAQLHPGPA
jgi:Smr domain